MRGMKQIRVSFRGYVLDFPTAKEAYVWLIDKFLAANPGLLDHLQNTKLTGWSRKYFARCRNDLFPASPHLAEDRNLSEPVSGGWFANVNMDNRRKRTVLHRLAVLGGFKYGVDWTWDDGSPGDESMEL
jgi:hypothetical protein